MAEARGVWRAAISRAGLTGRFLEVRCQDCAFVVTSTNKGVLDALVGPTDVLECVGTPYDVNELVERVKKAMDC
jgi:hypothetical protein